MQVSQLLAQDYNDICVHETFDQVSAAEELSDGERVYRVIDKDSTHRWFYRNYNVTTFNTPEAHRRLIFNLEPCVGSVFLMVRKTRRCYPNPYSCINATTGIRTPADCEYVHFMTEIDGSQDGTATFYEVPFTSTKYFISVYASENAAYSLTVIADIGAIPRPGGSGQISVVQKTETADQVELFWDAATYSPRGVSDTRLYYVYSEMLLDTDDRENMRVFLRKDKIMNTVCGIHNNTSEHYSIVLPQDCPAGRCSAVVVGVIPRRRYLFNVIVESQRGHQMAYSGVIMRTDSTIVRKATTDQTLVVVGSVAGSVLAMVLTLYFLLLQIYS